MLCEKCGKPIEDGQTLCSECAAQADDAATVMDDTFDLNTPDGVEQKKATKKKGGLIAAIVAFALVIACTLGVVFNLDSIKAFTSRMFKSPEAFFVDVEKAAIAEYKENLTESYGKFLKTYENNATAAEGEIRLTLGDTILELMETALQQQDMQMDVSWLQQIKLSLDANVQDQVIQYALGLGLGDQDILTADMILDVDNGKFYGAIPELSKDYLTVDMETLGVATIFQNVFSSSRTMTEKLIEALPSEEVLGSMIETYTDLILSAIKTVEKQDSTITVNGISQEVVELKATLTEAELMDIGKSILTEARNDQNLKKMIDAYGEYIDEMAQLTDEYYESEDLYQQFADAIDDALAGLDESKPEADSGNYMELKAYVDMKNELRGHSLTVYSKDEEPEGPYKWLSAVQDDTTYTEAELGEVVITGKKTEKDEISNGAYTLSVEGEKIGTLEFENLSDNGGKLRLIPSEELMDETLEGSSIPSSLLADNVAIELTFEKADSGKTDCELSVLVGSKPLIGFAISAETTDGGAISIPTEALDATDSEKLAQWLEGMNFDNVLTALENANVPADLLDIARGYLALFQYGMA